MSHYSKYPKLWSVTPPRGCVCVESLKTVSENTFFFAFFHVYATLPLHITIYSVFSYELTVDNGHLRASTCCLNHLPAAFQRKMTRRVDLKDRRTINKSSVKVNNCYLWISFAANLSCIIQILWLMLPKYDINKKKN